MLMQNVRYAHILHQHKKEIGGVSTSRLTNNALPVMMGVGHYHRKCLIRMIIVYSMPELSHLRCSEAISELVQQVREWHLLPQL